MGQSHVGLWVAAANHRARKGTPMRMNLRNWGCVVPAMYMRRMGRRTPRRGRRIWRLRLARASSMRPAARRRLWLATAVSARVVPKRSQRQLVWVKVSKGVSGVRRPPLWRRKMGNQGRYSNRLRPMSMVHFVRRVINGGEEWGCNQGHANQRRLCMRRRAGKK